MDVTPEFGHWLAGFIDGEGSFIVVNTRSRPPFRFQLCQRYDNGDIVREIHRRTGLGRVCIGKPRGTTRQQIKWSIQKRDDLEALIALLDTYSLRGDKAVEYRAWREGVLLWLKVGHRGRKIHSVVELKERQRLNDYLLRLKELLHKRRKLLPLEPSQ